MTAKTEGNETEQFYMKVKTQNIISEPKYTIKPQKNNNSLIKASHSAFILIQNEVTPIVVVSLDTVFDGIVSSDGIVICSKR